MTFLNYANPYGMTFGLNPGSGNIANPFAFWNLLIPDLSRIGIKKVRFQLSWDSLEVPQNTFNWGALDDAISHFNAENIQVTFPIRSAPAWGLGAPGGSQQASDEPWILADPTAFANFCTVVATRYDGTHGHGTIDRYEITNEEADIHNTDPLGGFHCTHASTSPYWGAGAGVAITNANKYKPARDPQYFVPILLAAYPAIKAVSPTVPVGMGAMWWNQPKGGGLYAQSTSQMAQFLSFMYSNGCKGNFDYINFHYYSNATDPTVGSNQTAKFADLLTELKAVRDANNDTVHCKVTEFGWQVPQDVPDGATQWKYYNDILEASRLSNFVDEVDLFTIGYNPNFGTGSSLTSLDAGVESFRQPTFANVQAYIAQYPIWAINPPPSPVTTASQSGAGDPGSGPSGGAGIYGLDPKIFGLAPGPRHRFWQGVGNLIQSGMNAVEDLLNYPL